MIAYFVTNQPMQLQELKTHFLPKYFLRISKVSEDIKSGEFPILWSLPYPQPAAYMMQFESFGKLSTNEYT